VITDDLERCVHDPKNFVDVETKFRLQRIIFCYLVNTMRTD
jgi:hypothetical protein